MEHVERMEKLRNAYKILVGKPEGKKLRSPRCRLRDNIKIDLQQAGHKGCVVH
jgi:hypothetical protein